MSRAKKTKLNPSSSSEDLTIYLRDPALLDKFHKYCSLDISPGRFVKFDDLADYNLHNLFNNTGLLDLYDVGNLSPHYPNLIFLFFTNLEYETSTTNRCYLSSLVKGIEIKLTPKIIGKILNIPSSGAHLTDIIMNDQNILQNHIFLPGKNLPMITNKLRPIPRLVSRILSYNMIPKTGLFDHMSAELSVATYAIMANIKVDWASVMFDGLKRIPSTLHPFGCFLTKIFSHFKVDLEFEKIMIDYNEIMDRTMVNRMKLGFIQIPSSTGDNPSSSSAHPQVSSPSSPQPFRVPSVQESLNNLFLQVGTLTSGQETLLKNQQDLHKKVDDLSEMMRSHFFPPPPPPSAT